MARVISAESKTEGGQTASIVGCHAAVFDAICLFVEDSKFVSKSKNGEARTVGKNFQL